MKPATLAPMLAAILLASSVTAETRTTTENYETVSHDCELTSTQAVSEPPEWTDSDAKTAVGRRRIVATAARAAMEHILKCGLDTWIGSVGQKTPSHVTARTFGNKSPSAEWVAYDGGIKELAEEDGSVGYAAIIGTKHKSEVLWSVHISYVQVQRKPDVAARSTYSGSFSSVDAQPAFSIPIQRFEEFLGEIEVFPAVFERGEYLVPGEEDGDEPWARDPTEAIKLILLHELGHLEAYGTSRTKLTNYPKTEDTEAGADAFASSAVRCEEKESPWMDAPEAPPGFSPSPRK